MLDTIDGTGAFNTRNMLLRPSPTTTTHVNFGTEDDDTDTTTAFSTPFLPSLGWNSSRCGISSRLSKQRKRPLKLMPIPNGYDV